MEEASMAISIPYEMIKIVKNAAKLTSDAPTVA